VSKRLLALLAGTVAIVAIVAGCGSSDDSTDATAAAAPTRAEFIKQGDAICKQGDAKIEAGFEEFAEANGIPKNQEPSNAQGVEIVETVIVPNIKSQGEQLRALGAPEGDEEQITAMLDSLDEAVEGAEEDPESLFDEKSDPFGDANKQAQEYGLAVCGQG
jgi:hypothetical protein